MITQARLKELFYYDPDTGEFIRKTAPARNVKIGDVAGSPHCEGYIEMKVDKKSYLAHRLAWMYITGSFPPDQIDHINHNRADNRQENLRPATHRENGMNCKLGKNNKTGLLGVFYDGFSFVVRIMIHGNNRYLGAFDNLLDAAACRKSADKKYGFHVNHGRLSP